MSLSDTAFIAIVEASLSRLAGMVEAIDEDDILDVEQTSGMLTIDIPAGKQFVLNRQLPTRQIWLSSPLSGGLRFDYDEKDKEWQLADGTRLDTLLKAEIETIIEEVNDWQ
ncbi:MAG: iron donor protein CyaY [Pseudomonadota bacterium]